eukprot:COSAG06_NODE_13759_length_1222_cov_1.819234_1_plen_193_part_00
MGTGSAQTLGKQRYGCDRCQRLRHCLQHRGTKYRTVNSGRFRHSGTIWQQAGSTPGKFSRYLDGYVSRSLMVPQRRIHPCATRMRPCATRMHPCATRMHPCATRMHPCATRMRHPVPRNQDAPLCNQDAQVRKQDAPPPRPAQPGGCAADCMDGCGSAGEGGVSDKEDGRVEIELALCRRTEQYNTTSKGRR